VTGTIEAVKFMIVKTNSVKNWTIPVLSFQIQKVNFSGQLKTNREGQVVAGKKPPPLYMHSCNLSMKHTEVLISPLSVSRDLSFTNTRFWVFLVCEILWISSPFLVPSANDDSYKRTGRHWVVGKEQ
jgi:hypothetical protein